MNLKSLEEFSNRKFLVESFLDIVKKKYKWVEIKKEKHLKEIADNFFFLVNNSYAPLGGHPSIPDSDAVIRGNSVYWEAIDSDTDDDADAVIFGRKSDFGIKIQGIGHDKRRSSKSQVINKLANILKKRKGYWVEASDRLAEILFGMNVPYLEESDAKKIFPTIEYLGDGKYRREVSKGKFHTETIFGNPNI